MNTKSGFTLIEILISLFIMSIMITAFAKLMSTTFKGMRTVTQSTELTTEAQLSTPIIVDRLQSAACIFPPGTNISFGNLELHQNTVRPGADSNWIVGTDPVLAMFMPPAASTPNEYKFFAYYPIVRSAYMTTNQIGPSPDVQNDDSVWMILEYKNTLTLPSRPNCDGTVDLTGGPNPRYLADFIEPNSNPSNPMKLFSYQGPTATDPRSSVTLNMRFKRDNGKRVETLPTDGSYISTKVFPRNIALSF